MPGSSHGSGPVVVLIAAKDMASSVGDAVAALLGLDTVDDVVVVDDGSRDGTGQAALEAGARVLRLPANLGKGGAVRAGVEATPEAGVYLLVDADVGTSASQAERLLAPVLSGHADLVVGVLPVAGRKGGVGLVRRLSAAGIGRATGAAVRAPLSGQRAVRADVLRRLSLAERFGLETAMTVDARRAGARMLELEVDMDHRHRGRSPAGFGHRAGQGADIVRALWPRLTTTGQRLAAIVAAFTLVATGAVWAGRRSGPSSVAPSARPARVVLFGVPGLSLDDLGTGAMPQLDALARRGAVAATSVRTLSDHPSVTEGYLALGAGAKVQAGDPEGGTAAVVRLNDRKNVSSLPGALGDALHRAGRRTAVIGRGAGLAALMDEGGMVDVGPVGDGPGVEPASLRREAAAALDRADVVLVDAGGAPPAGAGTTPRPEALASADRALAEMVTLIGPDDLLLVVSVTPPGEDWRLTPLVAGGSGVVRGQLYSPSTRRPGLVTLTDVAPTVLHALDAEVPSGMVGHALRYRPGASDEPGLRALDRDAALREDLYYRVVFGFIAVQSAVYLLAIVAFALGRAGRVGPLLRWLVLAFAAWPLATFAVWAVPGVSRLGGWIMALLLVVDAVIVAVALRARQHPLAPLAWICAATIALLVADVATGAHLQLSSFLGYSPYTAARFTGFGNTAFAALASSTILVAAVHVHRAPRRREAVVTAAGLLALVVLVDGAPWLGSDVGGILTLIPVFALTFVALAGRRLSWRTVVAAGAATALVVAVAVGVDLLRPPDARTHLGQLVGRVQAEGLHPLTSTLARKVAGSLRTFGSPWSWVVPIVILYGLYVLLRARNVPDLLAGRSALRAGALGMVAAGFIGCVLNDSGVVVTAVVFVYIAPFLTLLTLHRPAEPVMLEPGRAASPASATGGGGSDPLVLRP